MASGFAAALLRERDDRVMGIVLDNADVIRTTPLARNAKPWEMAALLLFLASPANGYKVAQLIFADGGLDAYLRPEHV